jgi:hypothetical protein
MVLVSRLNGLSNAELIPKAIWLQSRRCYAPSTYKKFIPPLSWMVWPVM